MVAAVAVAVVVAVTAVGEAGVAEAGAAVRAGAVRPARTVAVAQATALRWMRAAVMWGVPFYAG